MAWPPISGANGLGAVFNKPGDEFGCGVLHGNERRTRFGKDNF